MSADKEGFLSPEEMDGMRKTDADHRKVAERNLVALANEVGKAVAVATLQPGEELASPSEHAIVTTMDRLRRRAEVAEAKLAELLELRPVHGSICEGECNWCRERVLVGATDRGEGEVAICASCARNVVVVLTAYYSENESTLKDAVHLLREAQKRCDEQEEEIASLRSDLEVRTKQVEALNRRRGDRQNE